MKRILLVALLLLMSQLPLYSTIWVVSGKGDMAGASNANGGGYEGSRTWDDFQGANGGAKYTVIECDYNDGTGVITKAGQFAVNLDDLWVNVKEGAAGAWIEKRYKITASTADTITITAGEGVNANVDCWVGGAFDDTKAGIDAGLAAMAGGDTLMIATNPASQKNIDCAATITIPAALVGTASANCIIKGVDYADGGDLTISEQIPKLTGTASLVNGLLYFGNGANDYFMVENIEIDAGGVGKGDFCIKCVALAIYLTFKNCVLHNALDNAAFYSDGDQCSFINCEMYNSGYGIRSGSGDMRRTDVISCSFHDNTNDGVYLDDLAANILDNLFYDNGNYGLRLKGGGPTYGLAIVDGNTFYANDSDNIFWVANDFAIMTNNTMSGSTGGYGCNVNATVGFLLFANNHSYNNFSGHCDQATSDVNWAAFLGGNIYGDPLFEGSDTDGDFRPANNSPLLGAGYPDYFPFEGDRDNLQNYGHIGAVTRDEPAGGGTTTNIFINDKSGGKN